MSEKHAGRQLATGYAVTPGEVDDAIWGVSAPVIDGRNCLLGAISFTALVVRAQNCSERLILWNQDVALCLSARFY